MGDVVNIGGPTSGNTWAALRSPIWKGSGYRGEVFPANKNWSRAGLFAPSSTRFSSGYPEAVSPMMRAFPFLKGLLSSDQGWSTSMGLGCDMKVIDPGGGDPETPVKVQWFLNIGEANARKNYVSPYNVQEEYVELGYGAAFTFYHGKMGYDINSTRETMNGASVSVTLSPGPGMSSVTTTVSITDALFRDDPEWNETTHGISLGEYTWPLTPYDDWPFPHWTINSVTLA